MRRARERQRTPTSRLSERDLVVLLSHSSFIASDFTRVKDKAARYVLNVLAKGYVRWGRGSRIRH